MNEHDLNKDIDETDDAPSAASTLFDLRTVIAILFGVYGIILLIVALTGSTQAELDKAGGLHINLVSAIVMLVVSVIFVLWVRLKPTLADDSDADPDAPPAHH